MSVLDQNLDSVLEPNVDDENGVYSHGTSDRDVKKSNRTSSGNARKKIEEYQEEILLRKLTKGVFDD